MVKMSEEPDDYEGPWPEGDAMMKPIDDVMLMVRQFGRTDDELAEIRAAIESLAAPAVPDGWRLVPVEPTDAMVLAAWGPHCEGADPTDPGTIAAWGRMLGAAPAAPVQPVQAALPDGWVPLVVTLPDSHPEEVAYGPEVMMDRLGKWLEKHFAAVQAQSKPVVWRKRTTLNGSPSDVFVYRDGPRDGEREKWEPLFLHPPRADVARLRAALQFMLENFEHGDLNAGEAAALDKARDALRGN